MMILKVCSIIIIIIAGSICIRIVDDVIKTGDYIDKYCPAIGDCDEGTHVMCQYYNPNKKYGPLCFDVQNLTMTNEYAEILLNIMNRTGLASNLRFLSLPPTLKGFCPRVRSRTSRGMLQGKGDVPLPKGYGIMKLAWDEELATYAQLWANQCTPARDDCRATSRFPNPGQIAGLNRFTFEDWDSVSVTVTKFDKPGFTEQRVQYALRQIMKSLFTAVQQVLTPELVKNMTIAGVPKDAAQLFFGGSTTHVGCGISAYKEYSYYDDGKMILYNTIMIVCDFSTNPQINEPLYNTNPPTEVGYTQKCGCPPPYDEDEDCLCVENRTDLIQDCDACKSMSDLVVLPIFTVEDRPPKAQKNIERRYRYRESRGSRYFEKQQGPFQNNMYDIAPKKFKNQIVNENFMVKTISEPKIQAAPRTSIFARRFNRTRKQQVKSPIEIKNVNRKHTEVPKSRNERWFNDNHNTKSTSRRNIVLRDETNMNKNARNEHLYRYGIMEANINYVHRNYSKNIDDRIFTLLRKLEKEIENIELGDREREIIHEKIASIYRMLLESANTIEKRHYYENEIHNHENMLHHKGSDSFFRHMNRIDNRNNDDLPIKYNDNDDYNHRYDKVLDQDNNDNFKTDRLRTTYDIRPTKHNK